MTKTVFIGKMKDETGSIAVLINEEFVGLKLKMHSFQLNHNSKHKNAEDVNRNVKSSKCEKS